jgi:hypothetical protein
VLRGVLLELVDNVPASRTVRLVGETAAFHSVVFYHRVALGFNDVLTMNAVELTVFHGAPPFVCPKAVSLRGTLRMITQKSMDVNTLRVRASQ